MNAERILIWILIVCFTIVTVVAFATQHELRQCQQHIQELGQERDNWKQYSDWLDETLRLERKERGVIPELHHDCQEKCES